MGIKSAYELAMERASRVKVDREEIKRKAQEQSGKEAASAFLNKPKYNFTTWLSELPEESRKGSIKGVVWVFIKNITLPNTTADIDRILKIKEGFILISAKEAHEVIGEAFNQLITALQQYIDNSKTLLEQCKQEFAPKLQQKAMQIAQQTGQMVPIEPETDRDFIEFHRGQQEQVDAHYKQFISQITEQLQLLY